MIRDTSLCSLSCIFHRLGEGSAARAEQAPGRHDHRLFRRRDVGRPRRGPPRGHSGGQGCNATARPRSQAHDKRVMCAERPTHSSSWSLARRSAPSPMPPTTPRRPLTPIAAQLKRLHICSHAAALASLRVEGYCQDGLPPADPAAGGDGLGRCDRRCRRPSGDTKQRSVLERH